MASSHHWHRDFWLLLVVSAATAAASGSFEFVVCHLVQSSADISKVQEARSLVDCAMLCALHPTCRSATFCEQRLTQECSLSASSPSCQSLTSTEGCSFVYMNNSCDNGGVFNKMSITCDCPPGWQGTLCQTPAAALGTASIMSATTSRPLSVACLSGSAECATASSKSTVNQVLFCCPPTYSKMSTSAHNSVAICTCT